MNASIAALVCAPFLFTGFAAQRATRTTDPPRIGSRRPVDVSLEGLGEASARASGGPTTFDCRESIADQATGGCLTASSTPTLGMLYPYPGLGNLFVPRAFVGGGENNQATGAWSTVGGGRKNVASGYGSTVGGGGYPYVGGPYSRSRTGNVASGTWSTIGGGLGNIASGSHATVCGGGGGALNGPGGPGIAAGNFSAIGGGSRNTASGNWSAIGAGYGNTASGFVATVPGGLSNTALGFYSFAAGRRAKADHDGAFVWGDSFDGDKTSSAADEFNVYCSGGARFFTNGTATTGVALAAGAGSWSSLSDRDSKENVEPVDARAVLEGVAAMPISTWNYTEQSDSIRHMGPMAQDFHAGFGLGASDRLIDTIDADGVALAAIQGLNAELQDRLAEKDAEITELRRQVANLSRLPTELSTLEARLAALTERLEAPNR